MMVILEDFVSLFGIPIWPHFLFNYDSGQGLDHFMELETQYPVLIFINWYLQRFQEGLFGVMRQKLLLIDLVDFD